MRLMKGKLYYRGEIDLTQYYIVSKKFVEDSGDDEVQVKRFVLPDGGPFHGFYVTLLVAPTTTTLSLARQLEYSGLRKLENFFCLTSLVVVGASNGVI